MNNKQKEYIEQNIKLIEHEEWEEFFRNAPWGTGGIIYSAGIDFIPFLRFIPQGCFDSCSDLTNIYIPDNIKSIDYAAFYRCTKLTNIVIPDSVTSIDDAAFQESGLTDVVIPGSIISIGPYAFCGCSNLTNVIISDGVKKIEDAAFAVCDSLTSVKIPESVEFVSADAFKESDGVKITYQGTEEQWQEIYKPSPTANQY